ncbi:MAG: acyl-CoA dehydrogenase family protein [Deltaproteobacteria bacterium]|nr:acyl-CoA dehydrogenase family protein [Deltaproteobacteria bacterium]
MDLELNATQQAVQETARRFGQDKLVPKARERDRTEQFPFEELKALAELGLLGVNIPEELGGAAAGVVAYSLAMMELAAADASVSVAVAVSNMCAELIAAYGSDAIKKKYVPRITSGDAIAGAFALSEPHAGSDPAAMRTFAEKKGDRYVINGSKQWITSGQHAGVMVVWAKTSKDDGHKGISAFVVEGGTKGLIPGKPEEKMGLHGSNTVGLTFEDCEVPAENVLGEIGGGFKLAMTALNGGRIGIASQACGIARAAIEASARYAKERHAFGSPIGDFQAIKWFLADMKVKHETSRLLTLRAAWLKEHGKPFVREASMAKLHATESAVWIADKAVQIHGGYGYIDEFPVERYVRDARATPIYEGTNQIQRVVIARELLK